MQLDDGPRDEFDDLELDTGSRERAELDFDPELEGDGPNWPLIWVGVLLLIALLGVYFGYFRGRQQAVEAPIPEAPAEAPAEPAPAVEEPEPELELPALDASDAVVRELISRLSDHPQLVSWLATEELVRKFAVAVDNVAEGRSPKQHLRVLEPRSGFESETRGGLTVVDPASYRRYRAPAQLFASLDAPAVAKLYRQLSPLVAEAYRDLGYPDRDFDATMAQAIQVLVSTPVPAGQIALIPKVSTYEFADPTLEKLTPAQKHLVRMGPENAGLIQAKLAEIRDELGLE